MEADLEIAYRTLNALSQGQPVPDEEIELALACVNRAIHQVRALRRNWEEMSRCLQVPVVTGELVASSVPAPFPAENNSSTARVPKQLGSPGRYKPKRPTWRYPFPHYP